MEREVPRRKQCKWFKPLGFELAKEHGAVRL